MSDDFRPVWAVNTEEMAAAHFFAFLVLAFPLIPAIDMAAFVLYSGLVGKNPPPILQIFIYGTFIFLYVAFIFLVEMRLLARFLGEKIVNFGYVIVYLQVIPLSFIYSYFESSLFKPQYSRLVADLVVKFINWLFGLS